MFNNESFMLQNMERVRGITNPLANAGMTSRHSINYQSVLQPPVS